MVRAFFERRGQSPVGHETFRCGTEVTGRPLVAIRDRADAAQRLAAGRLLQRVHLAATARGLALQPLNQVFERVDREIAAGLEPTFGPAMAELTPAGQQIVTAFRIGHPTTTSYLSPRRRAEDVVSG
jgi:hypothetical protein